MARRSSSQNTLRLPLAGGAVSVFASRGTAAADSSPGILAASAGRSRRLALPRVAAASGKLAHGINGLVLRFVVGAGQQLADQTNGDELNTANHQSRAHQQERTVAGNNVLIPREFFDHQPEIDNSSRRHES